MNSVVNSASIYTQNAIASGQFFHSGSHITTAKLKSIKISYSHIYVAKFKPTNILAIAILGSTAKFNSRQYFRLYGICLLFHNNNAQLFLSAGCCHCYTTEISNLVTNKEFLPPHDFLALARKASSWSAADKVRVKNIEMAMQIVPESLRSTSFGKYFPSFIAAVCNPDGFNFHERTHNSNGKWMMANLIKASLGKCTEISNMYPEILVCEHEQCYFRVHSTTHSRGQPHSDPTRYQYTSDVVVMSFRTDEKDSVVEWMRRDSPRTPKCIIADAERSSLKVVIDEKITKMKSALKAYSTEGRDVLGLVLGGISNFKQYSTNMVIVTIMVRYMERTCRRLWTSLQCCRISTYTYIALARLWTLKVGQVSQ